jgi:hypothetical protein
MLERRPAREATGAPGPNGCGYSRRHPQCIEALAGDGWLELQRKARHVAARELEFSDDPPEDRLCP